jgi:hypothetical protein
VLLGVVAALKPKFLAAVPILVIARQWRTAAVNHGIRIHR